MASCSHVLALALLGLLLAIGPAGCSDARRDATPKQKTKRPALADSTNGARMEVLRWLVKLEPAFAIFQQRFTSARPIFMREDAYSPRISVTVRLTLAESTVIFRASAEFTDDLSRASKSRIEAFTALVRIDGKLHTVELPPRDMKAFAADPDGYIAKAAR